MNIGLMSISPTFLKEFEKLTKEQQKEYMSTRGDYAHMDKRVLNMRLNEALENIKHAKSRRSSKSNKKIDTSNDRSGSESSDSEGQETT